MADDEKIKTLNEKIKKERMVLDGALKMLAAQAHPAAKNMVEMSILEARHRIEFLEAELKKVATKRTSIAQAPAVSPTKTSVARKSEAEAVASAFDLLRYEKAITNEKVKFRFKEISLKLDIETRVRSGSENLVSAFLKNGGNTSDPKRYAEMESQLNNIKLKEQLLAKAKNRYSQIYVADDEERDDELLIQDTTKKASGRLRLKLIEAVNITGRKSMKDDIVATVSVDGVVHYTTKGSKAKWDEQFDIQINNGIEVEIKVSEKNGVMLALIWFKVQDLITDLDQKYGKERQLNAEVADTWLDLEPSGQILLKLNFISVSHSQTAKNKVFRRDAVQKIYPRNGHRYLARQFYQVMQCTVCDDFLGRQGYQCTSCTNTIHTKCYSKVVTKCIPLDSIAQAPDKNTGQLLKYKIPHRWDASVNLGASWCCHCGYILPPGKKIHRCSECNKASHRECSVMVPYFCGLDPFMLETLVTAFEEHEQKMLQKEMEEAEQSRKEAVPVFEQADMTQLTAALEDTAITPAAVAPPVPPPRIDSVPTPAPAFSGSPVASPTALREVTLDDFHFIAVLGRGAFGKVMLASEKRTNNLYAIKALKKEFIVQNDDVKSVRLEKHIFQAASKAHHPFMVNLHSSFDTPGRVYFVMEYVSGGDLMCHIQEKKRFHQGRARFYACEVLTALQYFHMNGIIYRDLKLDNILLGADGHIKVADYGICKQNMQYGTTTATFCGTPDYMAPEILMNRKYTISVDWWSFGVLIYVMLVGSYPFHGEDENDILEAILADAIEYPPNLPRVTLNLLQSLMHKNPARRLGASREDAEEVKKHPYFTGVDWDALLRKECVPPFVPVITNPQDVSNFDKEFTSEEPVLTPINSVLSSADQNEFREFNYIADWAFQSRVAAACAQPQ